ncbi:peptidase [Erythrobacter sp. KY5]|uniref:Mov34/MPN/PAD-1 family protein n=1 Tax=Erythrobacter sp. KY5 TaxID=2011159 RepID=UPI000DBF29D1|nr:M67 family metallopeptidase [Erythrobacter sp. KY5]AWW73880.1 peptidase [Erythrobacter sp. KY5]
MAIEVTREALEAMRDAAIAAYPREACGIMLGEGSRITAFRETANVHSSPETHFEIEAQALIDAHREARTGGPEVLGYFHSHPQGPPEPSPTDIAMAAGDGKIWAIGNGETITFWRAAPSVFEPLSYSLTGD